MGGVCLNRGCIPSKALLHITKVMDEAASLSKAGVTFGKPKIDIDTIRQHKDKIVSQLNNGIAGMAKARKVDFLQGKATFKSNSEVEVANGKKSEPRGRRVGEKKRYNKEEVAIRECKSSGE